MWLWKERVKTEKGRSDMFQGVGKFSCVSKSQCLGWPALPVMSQKS